MLLMICRVIVTLLILLHSSIEANAPCEQDCLQFDSSMFATSIDEALYNFPNLVSGERRPMFSKPVVTPEESTAVSSRTRSLGIKPANGLEVTSSYDCSDVPCRACKLHVINGFLAGQLDPLTNSTLWATKASLEASLNGITPSCPQSNMIHQPQKSRDKRVTEAPAMIGTTQTISCEYVRGNPISSATPFCGLCSLCWGWRQLPEDYYPHFLNEVHCSSDTTCLKGFGRCNPVTRSVNVLRKKLDASGAVKYEQVAIDTAIACECQVEDGSPIFNMVYGEPETKL